MDKRKPLWYFLKNIGVLRKKREKVLDLRVFFCMFVIRAGKNCGVGFI